MPTIRLPNAWNPRPYQLPLWIAQERGIRRSIAIWHRRAGKDDVWLHRSAVAAHERIGMYWHMLPQANQARKAVWDAINPHTGKKRIDEAFPLPLRKNTRSVDMAIELKCGSMWQLVGSDNYNSLVGTPPIGIVFSEWALADPNAWAYLSPILEENGGWAAFITTPRGKNHAYRMLQSARANPKEWFSEVLTIDDTGTITPERYETIKRERIAEFGEVFGEALCEQEYRCSFEAAVLGAYYSKEMADAERDGRICELPIDPALPVHTAWDLGVDDSTSIWFFQVLFGGVHVVDYYESTGVGVDHYVRVLDERGYTYGTDFVPHDANAREWGSGRTRIETMRGMGRKPRLVPIASKSDSIQAGRATIPLTRFNRATTERGRDALTSYHADYDEETRVLGRVPIHDWSSHGADAWQCLSMGWRAIKAEEPKPKPTWPIHDIGRANAVPQDVRFMDLVKENTKRRTGGL